jgi:hypothetical protein
MSLWNVSNIALLGLRLVIVFLSVLKWSGIVAVLCAALLTTNLNFKFE